MEKIQVDIKLRKRTGTTASKTFRRDGMLPGVLYSGGKAATSVLVPYKEFLHAAKKSKTSQVFEFKSEDSELNGKTAVVRDLQRQYTKEALLHVDFHLLEEGSHVKVRIPLVISGVANGVKNEGGVLQVAAREIEVRCLPKSIISEIVVDVTLLDIGSRTKTGDLELPEGVLLSGNPEETVVSVVATRATTLLEDEEAAAAEAAALEGEGAAEGEEAKEEAAE